MATSVWYNRYEILFFFSTFHYLLSKYNLQNMKFIYKQRGTNQSQKLSIETMGV